MIYSPLDQFEIKPLIVVNHLYTFGLTNYVIYAVLVLSIILGYQFLLDKASLTSSRWGVALNAIYDTIHNLVSGQLGAKGGLYFPLIFTLFNFILVANLISMIPYSFALSAQLVVIVALSLTIWLGNVILGLSIHGAKFFGLFVPSGTPLPLVPVLVLIETLSYSSRAISLGLRLSANILSGHLLMLILGSLIYNLMSTGLVGLVGGIVPIIGVVAIVILEVGISMIQAYVFSILTTGYIKDSVALH